MHWAWDLIANWLTVYHPLTGALAHFFMTLLMMYSTCAGPAQMVMGIASWRQFPWGWLNKGTQWVVIFSAIQQQNLFKKSRIQLIQP